MENAQPEPSMEEILASIRRIISEDEEEAPAKAPAEAVKAVETAPQPEREAVKPVVKPAAAPTSVSDDDANPRLETEDVEMLKKNVATAVADSAEEAIVDSETANAASQAFQSLSQSVRVSEGEGRTLEDMVIEMLRPMVKEWLDANLPGIVEDKVEEEVQRVARRRR